MPHQCTSCGRTFADGSKEMLSGCPDCGGNKFQFQPKGATSDAPATGDEPSSPDASSPPDASSSPDAPTPHDDAPSPAERSATSSASTRNNGGSDADDGRTESAGADSREGTTEPVDAPSTDRRRGAAESAEAADGEDTAQASARSDVVSPDELDRAAREPAGESASDDADGEEHRPNIGDLREELNDQFESIRIVSPGKYELNLMELYDRQEYIISLQEDGRYVIEMPDAWGASDDE
ncbi:Zn-ribbon domain-containing protein [Halorubrum gandharaense]